MGPQPDRAPEPSNRSRRAGNVDRSTRARDEVIQAVNEEAEQDRDLAVTGRPRIIEGTSHYRGASAARQPFLE